MIDKKLSEEPFTMKKKIQETYTQFAFFSYVIVPAVYDTKKAYSIEEAIILVKEGYFVQEDLGSFLFHAIINYE